MQHLRLYVNQNGSIRDYISPSGGALNSTWVYKDMAFISTYLLSKIRWREFIICNCESQEFNQTEVSHESDASRLAIAY